MQIQTQKINQAIITFEFVQNLEKGIDDLTPLYTSLEKFEKYINLVGFANKFTKGEKELWNGIFENILNKSQTTGITNLGTQRIEVNDENPEE